MLQFIPLIGTIIDKIFPDKEAQAKAKLELMKTIQEGDSKELESLSKIISQEAASDHWLAATWRPITMLVFLGMIVSWWFGYTPPNVTEAMILELFGLLKLGLGGYIIGRSAEKAVKVWKDK